MPASMKYIARRPRIAKTFDVSTMNGSIVIAKMAGMESTANTMSTMPISRITTNSGVAIRTPSCTVKKFSPSYVAEIRMWLRIHRNAGLASRSGSWPVASHIFTPVKTRNAPKR